MGDWKKTIDRVVYLKKILSFLTAQESKVFHQVFPVPSKNIDGAIDLAERHFRGQIRLREKIAELSQEIREIKEELQDTSNQLEFVSRENKKNIAEKDLIENKLSIALADIDSDSIAIKKRLSKLAALEEGGVDNWEWYGESLKNAGWEE